MTLDKFLKNELFFLEKKGIKDAKDDATLIFLKSFDLTLAKYLQIKDLNLLTIESNVKEWDEKISKFNNMIVKRVKHTPIQYILNEADFYNEKFYVDENVLIPRQDTEILVDSVLKENDLNNKNLLDICTGSGAIGISIAKNSNLNNLVLCDVSQDALNIAIINAKILNKKNTNIDYLQSDMFNNLDSFLSNKDYKTFDIITINPPYIKTSVIDTLEPEVKDKEPRLALDGGEDGIKFYRIIFDNIDKYLNDKSKVYMEIGYDEAEDIKKLYDNTKFNSFRIIKDLSKNDRVIVFNK